MGIGLYETVGAAADGSTNILATAEAGAYIVGSLWYEEVGEGVGEITISAEYFLDQEISTDYLGEYGHAYSEAALWAQLVDGDYDEDIEYLENELSDGASDSFVQSGELMLTLLVDGEGMFDIGAWVYNYAEAYSPSHPVPEPSTMLLLGLGLIGIVGVRRREFKK